MEPNTTPSLSLMSLFAPLANSTDSLQNNPFSANNAVGETTGMFASLLNQLNPEEAPLTSAPAGTAAIVPVIAVEVLPPAGNVLPLPTNPVAIDAQNLAAGATLTDPAAQVAALPLPVLPEATEAKHLANAVSIAASQPATSALTSAVAAVVAKPEPAKPLTSTTSVTTDRLQSLNSDTRDQRLIFDSRTMAAATETNKIQVEMTTQPSLQPLQNVAADNSSAFGTTSPLTSQPLAPTSAPQQSMTLNHPITDARWGDALGQKVVWMTQNGMGRAEIKLNPPELGPLNIQLSVVNDEAKVAFSVQHGTTRELVESALPRLREMFAEQGIDLTDASVSQHSPGDRQQTGQPGDSSHNSNHNHTPGITDSDEIDTMAESTGIREGLIDTYA